jgi:hypothetical protein
MESESRGSTGGAPAGPGGVQAGAGPEPEHGFQVQELLDTDTKEELVEAVESAPGGGSNREGLGARAFGQPWIVAGAAAGLGLAAALVGRAAKAAKAAKKRPAAGRSPRGWASGARRAEEGRRSRGRRRR